MRLKIILMMPLLIGILNSFQSCKKIIDETYYIDYVFTNLTDSEIKITAIIFDEENEIVSSYIIKKDSAFMQQCEMIFGDCSDQIFFSDSVVITFRDTLRACYSRAIDSPYNILLGSNFVKEHISENHDVYSYDFTLEDLDLALSFADE